MEVSHRRSSRPVRPRQVWLAMVPGYGQLGCSHRIRDSCPKPDSLLLWWSWAHPCSALIAASRCFSIVPVLAEDGMQVTALSMECPMAPHVDDTAIALLALSDRGQHPIVQTQFSTWNVLLRPLRRLGVSPGRSSRSPLTAGRLLRFTILLLHFLISQAPRTPARWLWSASLLTIAAPCRLSG